MHILFWIILMSFLNGLTALAGIFLFRKRTEKFMIFLVSFSIGALIRGAIFHLVPESIALLSVPLSFTLAITGFLIFFLLENLLYWHHCHEAHCPHPFTKLILYGDAAHNFIDGLLIASSFMISIPFGAITSLLIMAHELPQEIGDFAVLIYGGFKRKKALFYNFLAQITSLLGGLVGYFFLNATNYSDFLLPIAAGGFLYIAINDLIPEVLKEKNLKKRLINLAAAILGLVILISAKLLTG